MATNAVIGAPAAPDLSEPNSQIAPSSEKYRLTGEMPDREERSRTERIADESGKDDASAASSENAGSESASQNAPQKKTSASSESRWQKLSRENRELKEQLARAGQAKSQPDQSRETQQTSQPATEKTPKAAARPKIDDLDPKTNQPKYKTYAEYENAKDEWLLEEGARKAQEAWSKSTEEQRKSQTEQEFQRTQATAYAKVRKEIPDYDETVTAVINAKEADGLSPIYYEKDSPIDFFLRRQPDAGMPLMHHLAKNISDPAIKEIFARVHDGKGLRYALSNVDQIARLAVIAHGLNAPAKANAGSEADETEDQTSAKPVSAAPRPPHQTSGKGTVGKDAVAEAIEEGGVAGTDRYLKEANNRDPRLAEIRRRRQGK